MNRRIARRASIFARFSSIRHPRTSSYQLFNTVCPYDWRVRTFGWYRTSTLVRTRKFLVQVVRDFKHPCVNAEERTSERANERATNATREDEDEPRFGVYPGVHSV